MPRSGIRARGRARVLRPRRTGRRPAGQPAAPTWAHPECSGTWSAVRLAYSHDRPRLEVMSFEKELSHTGSDLRPASSAGSSCRCPPETGMLRAVAGHDLHPVRVGDRVPRELRPDRSASSVEAGSYTELQPSDPDSAATWRPYTAQVSLDVTDWSKGFCMPPPDVGGPYYHLDPTSEATWSGGGSSEALGYPNGEVIAFADQPDGTYIMPMPAQVSTRYRYLCPGWEMESEATASPLSFSLGGRWDASSDACLERRRSQSVAPLSGTTTWTQDPGGSRRERLRVHHHVRPDPRGAVRQGARHASVRDEAPHQPVRGLVRNG